MNAAGHRVFLSYVRKDTELELADAIGAALAAAVAA